MENKDENKHEHKEEKHEEKKKKENSIGVLDNKSKIDNQINKSNEEDSQKKESLTDKKITSAPTEAKDEKKKETPKKAALLTPRRYEAAVNARSLPISLKHSVAICKFIRGKKISQAVNDLEKVIAEKMPVPMRGEIPHRKGKITSKASGSGRYPKNAAKEFIKLLKSLSGNVTANKLEDLSDDLRIKIASANLASRPFGRFGSWRRKRTHVTLKIIVPKKKKHGAKSNKKQGEKK